MALLKPKKNSLLKSIEKKISAVNSINTVLSVELENEVEGHQAKMGPFRIKFPSQHLQELFSEKERLLFINEPGLVQEIDFLADDSAFEPAIFAFLHFKTPFQLLDLGELKVMNVDADHLEHILIQPHLGLGYTSQIEHCMSFDEGSVLNQKLCDLTANPMIGTQVAKAFGPLQKNVEEIFRASLAFMDKDYQSVAEKSDKAAKNLHDEIAALQEPSVNGLSRRLVKVSAEQAGKKKRILMKDLADLLKSCPLF